MDAALRSERRKSFRRFRDASITTKLVSIVAVFLFAIIGLIAMTVLALRITSGARAYVAGEGLWSKGQKDAVYFLSSYTRSQAPSDYARFEQAIAMTLGDRRARMEMSKPDFDAAIATQGFIEGGLAAEDVPSMIFLFRYFRGVGFFARAVGLWQTADTHIDQLLAIAREVRSAAGDNRLDEPMQNRLLARIDAINAEVTPLEMAFSKTLSEGARSVQWLLLILVIAAAVLLLLLGLSLSWWVSRDLNRGIASLRDGAVRVAGGDLGHRIEVRAQDELGKLAVAFNDMIERRHAAESALTTATEFRQRVMESSTNAIYTMDVEGRFTTANRRTCEITGYAHDDLIGRPWAEMVPPEYLPDLFARYAGTIQGRAPIIDYEVPLIQNGGNVVTITFSIAALSRDGEIFGVVGTAEDITERKRAQAALQSHADELARSNEDLEQFAYVASHDLQEPLRTVSGFAQLLEKRYRDKLGTEADEYLGFITSGAQRMKSLIEDLLAYSRVARDSSGMQDVDLNIAVDHALGNLQGAIDAAGAQVSRGPLPTLSGNRQQLVQLFQNLIGNAVKFRSAAAPLIEISAEPGSREWQFTVRDNGIGISERHARQVFVLFQRLHGRDRYPGNGIGLTICKKIVELHGGSIAAIPGDNGTTIRFTLRDSKQPERAAA